MTDKTTLDYLVAARAAIAAPENWCQRFRNYDGKHCAMGALDKATEDRGDDLAHLLAAQLLPREAADTREYCLGHWRMSDPSPVTLVAQFNNTHTHAEVLALFDRAIARQRVLEDRTLPAPLPDDEAKDRAPRSDFHDAWFPTI